MASKLLERLFNEAVEQYIDTSGKCRGLIFNAGSSKLVLFIRPVAPVGVPKTSIISRSVPIDVALKWCKDHSLEVVAGCIGEKDKSQITGIEVYNPSSFILESCYIPVKPFLKTGGIKFAEYKPESLVNPRPERTGSNALVEFRINRRVATVLEAYVLWTYSRTLHAEELPPGPDSGPKEWHDLESFEVIAPGKQNLDEYIEEILNLEGRLYYEGNDIIYSEGKIRVPNEITAEKLVRWLKVRMVRDPEYVDGYWTYRVVPDILSTVSDFRLGTGQMLFVNKTGLERWFRGRNAVSRNLVHQRPKPLSVEPYYFSMIVGENSEDSEEEIVIIQNVKDGKLEAAKSVLNYWKLRKVNLGYNPPSSSSLGEVFVLDVSSSTRAILLSEDPELPIVLRYEDGERFAAVLRL